MRLADLDVIVVGNPPPGFGGRYFIFVKLTTACCVVGWGEVFGLAEAVARAHPWTGERLHLEMSAEEADPRGARFGGG